MTAQREFTKADTQRMPRERRNRGRWDADDELGAVNLVTPEKRREAG
jgi:hypothetical protein